MTTTEKKPCFVRDCFEQTNKAFCEAHWRNVPRFIRRKLRRSGNAPQYLNEAWQWVSGTVRR